MHKIITITAVGLMIAAAIPAYASSDDASSSNDVSCHSQAGGQRLSAQDIKAKLAGQGYDVRSVKNEDGCYEVKALDKNGGRVEFELHPVTGNVIKNERKS